jgi:hypothetical protein
MNAAGPTGPEGDFFNKTKQFANQNLCYICSLDMEDWNMIAMCPYKKQGLNNNFYHRNNMQYKTEGC